jgi:hypothetical protein
LSNYKSAIPNRKSHGGLLDLLMGVVGGADEGAAFDVLEAEALGDVF